MVVRADAQRDGQGLRRVPTTTPLRCVLDKGLLPIGLDLYLELLDTTGRMIREDKPGAMPAHLVPILDRLGVNKAQWIDLVTNFDMWFGHIFGKAEKLVQRAAQAGRHWHNGRSRCAKAFG